MKFQVSVSSCVPREQMMNVLAAGFRNAAPLPCYIYSQRNIKKKCRRLRLSSALASHICEDLFKAISGLIWAGSLEQFNRKATALMEEWETLERSEKTGPPAFTQYFRTHELDEMRTETDAFILKDLGLGNKPYEQKILKSVNNMMKDWTKFLPQDMDRFIISLYDFMQSFDQVEELAWSQLSNKWEVCHQFQQHLLTESPTEMTREELKT